MACLLDKFNQFRSVTVATMLSEMKGMPRVCVDCTQCGTLRAGQHPERPSCIPGLLQYFVASRCAWDTGSRYNWSRFMCTSHLHLTRVVCTPHFTGLTTALSGINSRPMVCDASIPEASIKAVTLTGHIKSSSLDVPPVAAPAMLPHLWVKQLGLFLTFRSQILENRSDVSMFHLHTRTMRSHRRVRSDCDKQTVNACFPALTQ